MELPPLDILHEDNHCIAVCKPGGIASAHFQGDEQTLDQRVKQYLKAKFAKPGNVFLGIVHRLDKPVSGVLLFARTSKAAARLSEPLESVGYVEVLAFEYELLAHLGVEVLLLGDGGRIPLRFPA